MISPYLVPFCCSFDSIFSRYVVFGLPRLLPPCGFQSMCSSSCLIVYPKHRHLLFLTSSSMDFWLVLPQPIELEMTFDHHIPTTILKRRLVNVCSLWISCLVTSQVSSVEENRLHITFEYSTLLFTFNSLALHIRRRVSKAPLVLLKQLLMSSVAPPSGVMTSTG